MRGPEKLLHEFFDRTAAEHPGSEFVVHRGRRLTYREVRSGSDRFAEYLAGGILTPGGRIGLLLENSPEYLVAYFGILKAGGVVVPLNGDLPGRGMAALLNDFRPDGVVAASSHVGKLLGIRRSVPSLRHIISVPAVAGGGTGSLREPGTEPAGEDVRVVPVDTLMSSPVSDGTTGKGRSGTPDSLAMIIYTSGTTGTPKGVMLTHRNLCANALSIVQYLRLGAHDRTMVVLPFYYSYGNSLLTTNAIAGGTLVLENGMMYPNVVLEAMAAERVTGFSGVPSTYAILLNKSNLRHRSIPTLRYVTQAGGAMSPRHAMDLHAALPGVEVFIMYGQTEASARLSYLEPGMLLRKTGSIGKAIPGVTLALMGEGKRMVEKPGEVGEIVAAGENIMAGYWEKPEETAKALRDGWLHTGDYARSDEEGYLYIVGRRTDMIKSGAHRISAKEIEDIIVELPAVGEAAVVGMPDEILGETIKAYVVVKDGENLTAQAVQSYCRRNLPPFKVPKAVEFISHIPKTESGKPKKHAIEPK